MSDPRHIDPERLAALLDGRLNAAEAAVVRAELVDADEDVLGAYADAAAIANELSSRDRSPWRNRWLVGSLAAAAGIVAVVLGYGVGKSADAMAPDALVLAMAPEVRPADSPAWSVTRGGVLASGDRGRAVRLGALLVDLELAAQRAESSADIHAASISHLLEEVSTIMSRAYADSAGSIARRREMAQRAMNAVGAEMARVGSSLEAARLASASGDTAFFKRQPFESILDLTLRNVARTATDSGTIAAARTAARADDLPSIHAAAESLLRLFSR